MRRPVGVHGRGRPGGRCDTVRRARFPTALALLGAASLGCPQLLDDHFTPRTGAAGAGNSEPPGLGGTAPDGTPPDGAPPDGAPPDGPAPDVTPPTVTRSAPANGDRGVASDVSIEITFSEPMDTVATEAAYSSPDLPAASVDLSWRDADTVLVIRPREPLPIASGSDAGAVNPHQYRVELGPGASDRSGNALVPFAAVFSVARELTQTLQATFDRTLTGNFRNDGEYGVIDCEVGDTTICVGDGASTGEPTYRGFISFDLGALPSDRIAVVGAELSLTVGVLYGGPFEALGALQLERVSYTAIGSSAYDQNPETALGVLATDGALDDRLSADVLAAVVADAARPRSQFRLRFDAASDFDGAADLLVVEQATARLRVTYRAP